MTEPRENQGEIFQGDICEVNMGSPGGWDYDGMVDEAYRAGWQMINERKNVPVELDFNSVPRAHKRFAKMLLQASNENAANGDHFIVVISAGRPEKGKDDENSAFVKYFQNELGVDAALATFNEVSSSSGRTLVEGKTPTVIYLDANLSDIDLQKYNPLADAMKKPGLVVNPRGMEPLGDKGLFVAMSEGGLLADQISASTIERIPKTFFLDEKSAALAWEMRQGVIFKPTNGHSGNGFRSGHKISRGDIQKMLASDDRYIVQKKVAQEICSMEIPILQTAPDLRVVKITVLTDMRLLVGTNGFLGCFCRYNKKHPVNIGAGGGGQSLVVVSSSHSPKEATRLINEAICEMDPQEVQEVIIKMAEIAEGLGLIYKNRAIPISLTPRIISLQQLDAISQFGENLFEDLTTIEKYYQSSALDQYLSCLIGRDEMDIIKASPWNGGHAIIGIDGMFGF